jgi:hypothetical protein
MAAAMTTNEPEKFGDDFPPPEKTQRRLPMGWIMLAGALIALIALLALSY